MVKLNDKPLDIITVGSANMDTIAHVDNFPEIDGQAPVKKLEKTFGGSAANAAVASSVLGLKSGWVGKIGKDHVGEDLIQNFKNRGIDTRGVVIDPILPSGQVFIAVETRSGNGQKVMYAYPGAPQTMNAEDIKDKIDYLSKGLVVHLASLKNAQPFEEAARLSKEGDYILSMNPGTMIAGLGFDNLKVILDQLDILILSRNELDAIFGSAKLTKNVETCFSKTNVKLLVVTFGRRGSNFYFSGYTSDIVPIFKVPTVNTTGAGDAFCAGFLYKFIKDMKAWLDNQESIDSFKGKFCEYMSLLKHTPEKLKDYLVFANGVSSFVVQANGAQENLPSVEKVDSLIQTRLRF